MAFVFENPPILSGRDRDDIAAMRDYLIRMVKSLNETEGAVTSTQSAVSINTRKDGQQVIRTGGGSSQDVEAVKKNARELRELIIKSAKGLQKQIDEIEKSRFYIKYADDFSGDYPPAMYNVPTANTSYMGVCTSTEDTAPANPSAYTWSRIKGGGLNTATITLYMRASEQPEPPVIDYVYTFSTGELVPDGAKVEGNVLAGANAERDGRRVILHNAEVSGSRIILNEWTREMPDTDGRPCWAITATAISTEDSDTITAREWSEAVKIVEDGEPGSDGQDGSPGRDGEPGRDGVDGYNTAIIYLYKRSASAPSIDWSEALTYSFADKELTSVPDGWSDTPTAGTAPLYVTAATARSRTDTDIISANEWASPPVLFVENGKNGTPGLPGTDGKTTYLHIKYSDDGETFTGNDGEDVGAWIGTYTDYTEADSMTFSAYTWHRFADDTELQAMIEAGDMASQEYCDRKVESLHSVYVAASEYGTFKEEINTTIETTARNTVESYDYGARIDSLDQRTELMQKYLTAIDGEIRRGIVEDPTSGEYVTGIAISQNLKFSGECGKDDPNNPDDGYIYYYIDEHQTFGLYTSTGWQFWIDGYRRGWFNSLDNMLHVANIVVENVLQIGDSWQLRTSTDGTEFEILYVGA